MKKIILVCFIVMIPFSLFSVQKVKKQALSFTAGFHQDNFSITPFSEKDTGEKRGIKRDDILKDIRWDWFKSPNRLEWVLMGIGIVVGVLGLPFLLTGIIYSIAPVNAQTNQLSQNTNYAFIGAGSALLATAPVFIVTASVRLSIKKRRQNTTDESEQPDEPSDTD
jgi:hypothetical protein